MVNLYSLIAKSLQLPPRETISSFSERERTLSSETSANSGKWKNIGYQKAILDAVLPGKTVVVMTSTQIGKTECLKNIILHSILNESGGTTLMLSSESIATDFSKAQIEPLVRDTPALAALMGGAKKDGNSQLYRKWPGGYLRLVGSNSADKLSSFPSPRLIVDELDRCSKAARNSAGVLEGNPVTLFFERSKNWPNRFSLLTSTPTLEGSSAIFDWWKRSNQQIPLIPCPFCGQELFLDFLGVLVATRVWGRFVWAPHEPLRGLKTHHVAYECGGCLGHFTEEHLDRWNLEPKWLALNPESEILGFHLNAFYSPWTRWSELVQKKLDAGQNPGRLMTFWNTTGGWPYSFEAVATPDWEKLARRPHEYKRYEVPSQVSILLAACDVQMDRLEVSVFGVHKSQFFLITHEALHGNPAQVDDQVWSDLDEFLGRTWTKENKMPLVIHKCAMDAHYLTNTVAQYARSRRRIVPVTGVDNNWSADVMPAKPLDIKRNGKYYKTGKKRWPLGVSIFKMDLYTRLKLPDKLSLEYMHFPSGMPDEYYKQITGEVCKLTEDSKGRTKTTWEKNFDAVEALDCAVYALALYKICGFHLWPEAKWNGGVRNPES
jgi:phage terminase large subunit GpA-like protein